MGNPYYLFKFPRPCPRFDYESLNAWLGERETRKLGTTVTISRYLAEPRIEVFLYDFWIATITPERVDFLPKADDGHKATTEWLAAIARHNGIASGLWRRRRRKSDGPGPMTSRGMAGVLVAHNTADSDDGPAPGEHTLPGTYKVFLERRDKTLTWVEKRDPEAINYG